MSLGTELWEKPCKEDQERSLTPQVKDGMLQRIQVQIHQLDKGESNFGLAKSTENKEYEPPGMTFL